MKRIEQLLHLGKNIERFNYLANNIKDNKLAVFFGAGLSLWPDYRKWEYPFVQTQDRVENAFQKLKNYYDDYDDITLSEETNGLLSTIINMLEECIKQKDNKDFLRWGEALDKVVFALKNAYDKTSMIGEFEYSCFDDLCVEVFREKGAPPVFDVPYGTPAIYYLPFLCSLIITTNVDSSFEEVCNKTGIENWTKLAILKTDMIDFDRWNAPSHSILYIHGHINEPQSLIMTYTQYESMYPKIISSNHGHKGARNVLNAAVNDFTILFLGASLQGDRIVEIINQEAQKTETKKHRKESGLHFIPITKLKQNGELDQPPKIRPCEPVFYTQYMHGEIPIFLLHLIRETAKKNDYCTWQKPDPGSANISEKSEASIRESLKRTETIDYIQINDEPDNVIRYLFEHYSIAKHDSGLGWSICRITDADFSLAGYHEEKGEPFSPLHNYPIGDTIYILVRGDHLSWEEEEPISQEISKWHKDAGFPDRRAEDPQGDKVIVPRIRIIRFSLSDVEAKDKTDRYEAFLSELSLQGRPLPSEIRDKLGKWLILYSGISIQELFLMLQDLLAKGNTRDIDIESNTKALTRTLKP